MTNSSLRLDRSALRLMADRGQPLHLETHNHGHGRYTLTREGHGETEILGDPQPRRFRDALKLTLLSYGPGATVDGSNVPVKPFSGTAPIIMSKKMDREPDGPRDWDLITSDNALTLPKTHNVLIAGVAQYWPKLENIWRSVYNTPAKGGNEFWQNLLTVVIQPIPLITTADLDAMSKEHWNDAVAGLRLPPRAAQNASEQTAKAMTQEDIPPPAVGRIYRYAAGDADQMNQKTKLIAVTGNPLLPPAAPGREAELVSLMEKMYQRGPDVPVWLAEWPPHYPTESITSFEIEHQATEGNDPPDGITQETKTITAFYTTSDGRNVNLTLPFHATGDAEMPEVWITKNGASMRELPEMIARAYWGGVPPKEQTETPTPEETARKITAAVRQLTEGREPAHRRELENFAARFDPGSTAPAEEITITTGRGGLTITSHPNPDCEGCGRPVSKCDYDGRVCRLHGDHACIECRFSPPEHLN